MVKAQRSILFGPLPPPQGGVSVFMSSISAAAIGRGVRVWSYSGTRTGARFVDHRRFAHLRALLCEGRNARVADSTHFHLEYPNPILLLLWLSAKAVLRFRWIKILHDGSLPVRFESFSRPRKLLFRQAVGEIEEFIVSSRDLEPWLRDVAGFEGNITYIAPLLPLPADWGLAPTGGRLLENLDRFSAHKRRVCSVGVFIASYGFHHVAEAVEILREKRNEDIGLLLLDGNFVADEAYRADVLAGRDWIEVAENVPHPFLKHAYSRSDIFVRGFEHESFGLSRIESLWCGTPVVATSVGETRGMLLYDYGDIEQLCGQMDAVLDGQSGIDISMWADVFKKEAEKNLETYVSAIAG